MKIRYLETGGVGCARNRAESALKYHNGAAGAFTGSCRCFDDSRQIALSSGN